MPQAIQHECRRLWEACGESALPHRTVARLVKDFNEGCQNVADMCRPGRPSVSEDVYPLTALLDSDQRHTIRDLAWETRLGAYDCASHSEGMPGHEKNCITMGSAWFDGKAEMATYDTARNHLECYECEEEAFLRCIITLDETWAKSYEPQWNAKSTNGVITGHHDNQKFVRTPAMWKLWRISFTTVMVLS